MMNESALSPRVRHQLKIVADAGFALRLGVRILDLGCGEGNSVLALRAAGFDAWGCDISLYGKSPESIALRQAGYLREIALSPYRLPFEDESFDLILSSEVLEHVMDYESFIAENRRVQAPGGMSMHIFPGKWTPIEGHVFVPFASVHRSHPWLLLWALLGVRNGFQKGKGAREVARLNWSYLREHTNYLSTAAVREQFGRCFSRVSWREDLFLQHSESPRGRMLARATSRLPWLLPIYRSCWNRVLVVAR
jgi:SAM-dependent methyltransferase